MAFTIDPEAHKQRRSTIDPNFSKRRVAMMENGIYEELEKVFARITEYGKKGEVVPIAELFFCYTVSWNEL